ncbi:uncharacterized protein K441DRAFT_574031, partial [Cenococcum geophilum 1.58]|uniref:uncharacterized protein n=1 Tax=Cenococcum geophilum 1.58 TaxID=794803 RepID=UPI00358E906A
CEVTFYVFVLDDLEETPYIYFTSYRVYSYTLPPLNKPPLEILNEVIKLVC